MENLPAYFTGLIAILLLSSFVKILTTLSILRYGIGLNGVGFGLVVVAVSLSLTMVCINPQLNELGGFEVVSGQAKVPSNVDLQRVFSPFLEKHASADIVERFTKLGNKISSKAGAGKPAEGVAQKQFPTLIASFLISELREAFKIGFILLIPLIVIDLLVVNVLMALGVTQISYAVVSLPLKILLFFGLDGWTLISEKLLAGYF